MPRFCDVICILWQKKKKKKSVAAGYLFLLVPPGPPGLPETDILLRVALYRHAPQRISPERQDNLPFLPAARRLDGTSYISGHWRRGSD